MGRRVESKIQTKGGETVNYIAVQVKAAKGGRMKPEMHGVHPSEIAKGSRRVTSNHLQTFPLTSCFDSGRR